MPPRIIPTAGFPPLAGKPLVQAPLIQGPPMQGLNAFSSRPQVLQPSPPALSGMPPAAAPPLPGYGWMSPGLSQVLLAPPPPPASSAPFTSSVSAVNGLLAPSPVWKNQLSSMLRNNQAVIYALNIRTFGAHDKNGDHRIDPWLGENGTFLSSIPRLPELAALGVNTLHVLPINPVGQLKRLGEAGSLYATADYTRLNPEFDVPFNGLTLLQEARMFVDAAHRQGIHVMVDLPSCASMDLALSNPELIARNTDGKPLTPTTWIDILMMENGPALINYWDRFFDLMINKVGVDGFRVDVARARDVNFWQPFINKYPQLQGEMGLLAESYTIEDDSPLENIPRDIPFDLLRAGFDTIYGNFHIFPSWTATDYMNYILENRRRMVESGVPDRSLLGSFLTHDDPSLMPRGGVPVYLLSAGLMCMQPYTVPYLLDGFTTGYEKPFDIFNWVERPTGQHPEIGLFTQQMLSLRRQYQDVVTRGLFIPIPLTTQGTDNNIIAFARYFQGKTLLVLANKDVNARHQASLNVPTLLPNQPFQDLAPYYGQQSRIQPTANQLDVDLSPGAFHVFALNTPLLPRVLPSYH
ncbi:MAG: hypothetical protein SFZ03_03200 [Candidatus Melainabacteria bacterium]|nr:hypothetical protein [Candidatus Melainabacteria bacterium]